MTPFQKKKGGTFHNILSLLGEFLFKKNYNKIFHFQKAISPLDDFSSKKTKLPYIPNTRPLRQLLE
jgi:hypothetical protein